MNITRKYNDELDGDFLACRPGYNAEGLEGVCTIGVPVVGWASLFNGMWLLYLAYIQRNHRKRLNKQKKIQDGTNLSNVRRSSELHPKLDATVLQFSHIEKLLMSTGVAVTGFALMYLIYGFGTIYPRAHIRGQAGDAIAIIPFAAMWYLSLLGHRGAIYFKSSIPQPKGLNYQSNELQGQFHMPSPSTVLNVAQSWLAFPISFLLWGLMQTGLYTRSWYLLFLNGLTGVYGLRTFVAIVRQRLRTLKQLANIVNAAGKGTRDEINRRKGFFTSKTTSLVLDLTTVFCMSVLIPVSYVLLGSTFNSRQCAIHVLVNGAVVLIPLTLICVHLHSKFRKLKRKRRIHFSKTMLMQGQSGVFPKGKSLPSGLSVVQQSDV